MKIQPLRSLGLSLQLCLLTVLGMLATGKVFAEVEIDLDEASKPAPTVVIQSAPVSAGAAIQKPSEAPVPATAKEAVPAAQPTVAPNAENAPAEEKEEVEVDESSPEAENDLDVSKMKNVYEAGIKAYQERDYDRAIRYLKKAVLMKDKYTPKFYYAEAYATLGIIYQFHIIRYKTAYTYYKYALKYEHNNRTARRHLKEVAKHLRKRS